MGTKTLGEDMTCIVCGGELNTGWKYCSRKCMGKANAEYGKSVRKQFLPKIKKLYKKGLSIFDISLELGYSNKHIHRLMVGNNITRRKPWERMVV